ncbi:MAG: sigma-70 family RNA polymerase sigma factor [Blastomonas sp.]|jgi:RNA polymerase sigma factor (sigma-70 family)|uniref:RNA polymerase sigma factor n=1 Tax=unclassified Blastomonas TaxID=2626550 RepID=UPI0006B922BE|nr:MULTISPECIES: sigma-70 family RNA polymerase sigma factor [unclassified Blastomonas]MCO5795163.1 sigma-70 family RNA polymerase sigma factor [Blastomonas sp.]
MSAAVPHRAFEEIYRTERTRLLNFFRWKIGPDDASDLVQETFARVWQSGAFDRLDNPQGYLTRTAQNLLIDLARKRQRHPSIIFPLDEARDAPLPPHQEWGIEAMELRASYRRALLALPRRTRRIFLMQRLKGMTYREVGRQLGVGTQCIEYHMMRALAEIRKTIDRWQHTTAGTKAAPSGSNEETSSLVLELPSQLLKPSVDL